VWDSPDVLKHRAPRVAVAGLLLALTLPALAACRTSPGVAAYIGSDQVTMGQLDSAMAARTADPAIAAYQRAHSADFTRKVLNVLILKDVFDAASVHYGVQVDGGAVQSEITKQLGSSDPASVFAQLAQQGISRDDIDESIREQLLVQQIAAAAGKADTSEAALRARYTRTLPTLKTVQLGYIDVPDQAVAKAVVAQLTAKPAVYPAVAAKYPGQYTLAAAEATTPDKVPGPLAAAVARAAANTAFALSVPNVPGVIVGFVGAVSYPTFQQQRAALEQAALAESEVAGSRLVTDFQKTLHVTVNPRFGSLQNGKLLPVTGGVVRLDQAAGTAAATPSTGGQ
jgi:peptidyl-prolyl cis-trans isomerase SurA